MYLFFLIITFHLIYFAVFGVCFYFIMQVMMLQEKQIGNASWKIPISIVKYIQNCCDSIFRKASSYAFIKAVVWEMGYEEKEAGRL